MSGWVEIGCVFLKKVAPMSGAKGLLKLSVLAEKFAVWLSGLLLKEAQVKIQLEMSEEVARSRGR